MRTEDLIRVVSVAVEEGQRRLPTGSLDSGAPVESEVWGLAGPVARMSTLPMAREMEGMDWLATASTLFALMSLSMAQRGKKSWAADRPIPLVLNIIAGVLGTAAAAWALYWPGLVLQNLWLASSVYNLVRVQMNRRDIRMLAEAKKQMD